MQVNVVQRWREQRGVYRPAGEPIATRHYEVAPIGSDREAKSFVLQHHYSGSYPAARQRFGLYRHDMLVGVAVYSVPYLHQLRAAFGGYLPDAGLAAHCAELGRLVLLDDVPANGESWFVGRTFELLRGQGYQGIVSMSDPVARMTASGERIFPGHIGTIYQALNAAYLGLGRARTLRLLPDGSVLNERALQKIRAQERGWRYGVGQLVEAGADVPAPGADICGWLYDWLPRVTRPLRHTGNHRYAWLLDRRAHSRQLMFGSQHYPKWEGRGRG